MFNYTKINPEKMDFFEIMPFAELGNGERLFIEVKGKSIVLLNLAGQLFAIGDVCTHDQGSIGDGKIEGAEIICPRHGARFAIIDGKATGLPAVEDIPAYPVRVSNGIIEVGIPGD
jgi:3-phenylpropionate/trans-cinnamate dioxygenase ferredoxin subunit